MFIGLCLAIAAVVLAFGAMFAALTWLIEPGSFGAPIAVRMVQTKPRCFWVERRSRTGWQRSISLHFFTEAEAMEAMALASNPRIVATQCRP